MANFNEPRTSSARWFWISIVFDALLFIATSTYAYIAYHQWKVMNNQASLMNQQLETTKRAIEQTQEMLGYAHQQANASSLQGAIAKESERPYVTVTTYLNNVAVNSRPSYVIVVTNSGKTTARKFSISATIQLSGIPLSENPVYPDNTDASLGSVFDLGTGHSARNSGTARFLLTSSDLASLKQRKTWLYVYGKGEYLDGQGELHTMKYCSLYDPSDSATQTAAQCEQHNSSN
jgi:hypothetical protein